MARTFNGTTDRIDWPNIADLAGSAITFSAWVWFDDANGNGRIFDIDNEFYIGNQSTTTSRRLQIYRKCTSGAVQRIGANPSWTDGQWTHVCVTSDGTLNGSGCHIYVNGTELSDYTTPANGTTAHNALTGVWSLAGHEAADLYCLAGRIAAPGIWDAVLDSTTIASLAAGYTPSNYTTNLLWAPPLDGSNPEVDPISTEDGTLDGTTSADDPTLTWPSTGGLLIFNMDGGFTVMAGGLN